MKEVERKEEKRRPSLRETGAASPRTFWLPLCLLASMPCLLPAHLSFARPSPAATPKPLSTPLRAFTAEGRRITLAPAASQSIHSASSSARWTVLYFWSGSCPCVTACERFSLRPLAQKYTSKVAFFALASNNVDLSAPASRQQEQTKQSSLPYPLLLDRGHAVALALHASVTPETFLLDPTGKVVFHGVPDDSWEINQRTGVPGVSKHFLANALAQALSGKKVVQPSVKALGCGIEK